MVVFHTYYHYTYRPWMLLGSSKTEMTDAHSAWLLDFLILSGLPAAQRSAVSLNDAGRDLENIRRNIPSGRSLA